VAGSLIINLLLHMRQPPAASARAVARAQFSGDFSAEKKAKGRKLGLF
jgi:hypothetical protein